MRQLFDTHGKSRPKSGMQLPYRTPHLRSIPSMVNESKHPLPVHEPVFPLILAASEHDRVVLIAARPYCQVTELD